MSPRSPGSPLHTETRARLGARGDDRPGVLGTAGTPRPRNRGSLAQVVTARAGKAGGSETRGQQEDYTTDEDLIEGVEGKLGNGSGAGGILDLLKASRQVGGPDYAALT